VKFLCLGSGCILEPDSSQKLVLLRLKHLALKNELKFLLEDFILSESKFIFEEYQALKHYEFLFYKEYLSYNFKIKYLGSDVRYGWNKYDKETYKIITKKINDILNSISEDIFHFVYSYDVKITVEKETLYVNYHYDHL